MSFELAALSNFLDMDDPAIEAVVDLVGPFMPVLKRLGKDGLEAFMNNSSTGDFTRVTTELYEKLTEDERDQLSDAVLADAQKAVNDAFRERRDLQQQVLRVAMAVALSLV